MPPTSSTIIHPLLGLARHPLMLSSIKKPNYFTLHPFGCTCFVLLPLKNVSNSLKSTISVFLGYGIEHKGVSRFDPKIKCLRTSWHVTFVEYIMFYSLPAAFLSRDPPHSNSLDPFLNLLPESSP